MNRAGPRQSPPAARLGGEAGQGTIALHPVPPFDLDLSAAIFSGGDPGIRSYQGGAFRQVLRADGELVLVIVTMEGTPDHPVVKVRVRPRPHRSGILEAAGRAVSKLFNLGLDLAPFISAVRDDPIMSAIARRLRGLKPPRTETVFEALVDSIIEQQVSLTAAHSMEERLVRHFGEKLELEGKTYHAFPSPERLAAGSAGEFRACGLSGKKAEYIAGIARLIREGNLDLENHGPGEETAVIIRKLTDLRGVGVWTAELAVLRGLSRLDAIPADDLGIRRAITGFYSRSSRVDAAEARRIAEAWGAWRGLAASYLLFAERMGMGPETMKTR